MKKHISTTETAKLIRKALKQNFPSVRFSVRSKKYSGGSSIDVSWIDGPTTAQVDKIVKHFEGASFDPMIDLKSYVTTTHEGQEVHFQSDYVFTRREYSVEFTKSFFAWLYEQYRLNDELPLPEVYAHEDGTAGWHSPNGTDLLPERFRDGPRPYLSHLVHKHRQHMPGDIFGKTHIPKQITQDQWDRAYCENRTTVNGHKFLMLEDKNRVKVFTPVIFEGQQRAVIVDITDMPTPEPDQDPQPDPEKVRAYKERRQAKAERYKQFADNAARRSEQALDGSLRILDVIPPGQPILVGHHSEKRHRRDLDRVDRGFRKANEEDGKAKHWAQRAENIETDAGGIRREDPEAIVKLKQKIEKLVEKQETMKAINKAHTAFLKDPASLDKTDFSSETKETIRNYKPAYSWEPHPFPRYALSNNNANIRRYRQRLERLQKEQARDEIETTLDNGTEVRENADYGSIEIVFPGKPNEEIRSRLKLHGFRWASRSKCWYKRARSDSWFKMAQEIAAQY